MHFGEHLHSLCWWSYDLISSDLSHRKQSIVGTSKPKLVTTTREKGHYQRMVPEYFDARRPTAFSGRFRANADFGQLHAAFCVSSAAGCAAVGALQDTSFDAARCYQSRDGNIPRLRISSCL